jgi:hypothetical protein
MPEEQKPQEIKVELPPELRGGVYCNNMVVSHTREEFVMDFMMIVPPNGVVTSRVIMSPSHMKRTISALQVNLQRYEEQYGKIQESSEPPKGQFGFSTS